jgi:hypothetical protein
LQAFEYYFEALRNVLDSFNVSYSDLGIPDSYPEFSSLLRKCLVLEFLIVTVIKPILSIDEHEKLWKWHKVKCCTKSLPFYRSTSFHSGSYNWRRDFFASEKISVWNTKST